MSEKLSKDLKTLYEIVERNIDAMMSIEKRLDALEKSFMVLDSAINDKEGIRAIIRFLLESWQNKKPDIRLTALEKTITEIQKIILIELFDDTERFRVKERIEALESILKEFFRKHDYKYYVKQLEGK